MRRAYALLAILASVGVAAADIGPPPGIKRIPYEAKITTEKEIADFAFFSISGGDKVTSLKLDPKTPAVVKAGGGRYRQAELVAVPAAAEKGYASEKEFHAALFLGTVKGQVKYKKSFNAFAEVKEADTRKAMVVEFKLLKLNENEFVLEEVKPTKEKPKNAPDDETTEELSTATAPAGGLLVPGVAAFLGFALAGLWLARKFK